jgi:hypothetical protein
LDEGDARTSWLERLLRLLLEPHAIDILYPSPLMSKYHPQAYYDAQSLLKVNILLLYIPICSFTFILEALEVSSEKKKARRALRKRIGEIIRSHAGDDFDVEDVSMRKYVEDVDIAPIEFMIVVRAVIYRLYGQLLMSCPGPPLSCRPCHGRPRTPYFSLLL